jgi:hypothetical protein
MMTLRLDVDLVDKRTGCIEGEHIAVAGLSNDRLGDAMCRKDHGLIGGGDLIEVVHKNGTFCLESINDKPVVDDLMPDVDGSAVFGQCQLHDLDGSIHAGAKAARRGQENIESRACG